MAVTLSHTVQFKLESRSWLAFRPAFLQFDIQRLLSLAPAFESSSAALLRAFYCIAVVERFRRIAILGGPTSIKPIANGNLVGGRHVRVDLWESPVRALFLQGQLAPSVMLDGIFSLLFRVRWGRLSE